MNLEVTVAQLEATVTELHGYLGDVDEIHDRECQLLEGEIERLTRRLRWTMVAYVATVVAGVAASTFIG
ncbi:MAG: hypothetical protein KDB40_11050 [Acidimicrobiales bacterium]|nr:hypothetical protein [Acidimicrobiales bacterium]MCB9393816.1 hypothetical protein [Acidimicrobiaceae bacterium]